MLRLWSFQWLLLHFIFGHFNVNYVTTTWPSSNYSSIQLLGLFPDLLNTSEPDLGSVHARAMFKAAVVLSQQYNITIEGEFIEWQSAETGGNMIDALSSACQAISTSNIVGIVGPGLSREAQIIAPFAETIGIPVISYSATDPSLSDRNAYPAFYRTVPSDNSAASAIVKLFIRFNWKSCVIIYQNDAFGSGGAKVISEAFSNNGLTVGETIMFDIATLSIRGDLKTYLTNSATRIVVVWAYVAYRSLILQNALDSNVLGPQFTWILSGSVPLNSFNQTFYQNLVGMLTVEPVSGEVVNASVNTTLLNAAYNIWQKFELESYPGSTNVDSYALFTFDATWTLIRSLQELCSTTTNSSSSCVSFSGSSFCFNRRFINSKLFFDTVSAMAFVGVSGPIQFRVNVTDRTNGTYYYARNVQPSSNDVNFVPVLEYADPGDWRAYPGANVIVWPGTSLNSSTDRAKLSGVNIRIGVIESPPFTIVTNVIDASGQNTRQLIGYVPDLIELLRTKMGFIPDIQLASSNQTYPGLIQAVADGVYDIVVGDVVITAQRRELVGFSASIFDHSVSIIMRKTPDVSIDLLSFLKPFSRNLWLLILVACVYAGLLLCLIERQDNEALQNRSISSQATMSVWYSFGNLVGFGVDFEVITAAGRLLTVGLYILGLVLVASYTANLASDLTLAKSAYVISGISDIKNGKIPFNRVGIRDGTADAEYYLAEISGNIKNYYPLKSTRDAFPNLLAGNIDVAFIDTSIAVYETNNIYCNITVIGESFDEGQFAIPTPKEWLYAQDLDFNILLLKESGDLDNLKTKWFETKNCPDSTATSTAMGIETMGGLFLTFAAITILSLLLFAWTKRYKIKNHLFVLLGRKNPLSGQKGFDDNTFQQKF